MSIIKKTIYSPEELNSNIAYGMTSINNITQEELDSIQWLCEVFINLNYYFKNSKFKDVNTLIKSYKDLEKEFTKAKQQLAEKEKNNLLLKRKLEDYDLQNGYYISDLKDEIKDLEKENKRLEQQLQNKDTKIEDLEKWQSWYSMWHKKFKKQIEDLQTELETYRPTKLKGNGQCICYGCEQKGEFGRFWTDWCSQYKGHIYCDKCLKELLEKEKTAI